MKTNRNTKLPQTTNYDLFEMHPLNRPLQKTRARLTESMLKYGFPPSCAIHVKHNGGEKLLVVRGHHRLEIAKKLGLPVYYIIDDTPFDIFELEGDSAQKWSVTDFLVARSRNGDKECQKLLSFIRKHKIPTGAAASLVGGETAGSGNNTSKVKRGTFRVRGMERANKVVSVTDYCSEAGFSFAVSSAFVSAVSACLHVAEFDYDLFMEKLHKHGHRIKKRGTRNEYLEEIETIYNYGSKANRLNVAFLAIEASRQRHVSFGKTASQAV